MAAVAPRNRVSRSLDEKLAFVRDSIQRHGLSVHPQSRLAKEAAVFVDPAGQPRTVSPTDPGFRDALEALRDYTLFEFILDAWPFDAEDGNANERLRLALKDAVDPHAPARQTPGRDTQLELYVATAMHRAGLPPVLGTPDVRVRLNRQYFYVEAKRPKTAGGIENAVRDAVHQVESSACPGAVFLDVSLAFNPRATFVTRVMPDAEFQRLHEAALHAGVGSVAADVKRLIAGRRVATVCFQDHQLRQTDRGWVLVSCVSTLTNPGASGSLAQLAMAFERSLDMAWPR